LEFVWASDFHRFLVDDGARCSDWCSRWLRRGYFAKEERSQGLDRGELIGWGFLDSVDRRGEACSAVALRILSVAVILGTGMAW
jgi:hypothetical protein